MMVMPQDIHDEVTRFVKKADSVGIVFACRFPACVIPKNDGEDYDFDAIGEDRESYAFSYIVGHVTGNAHGGHEKSAYARKKCEELKRRIKLHVGIERKSQESEMMDFVLGKVKDDDTLAGMTLSNMIFLAIFRNLKGELVQPHIAYVNGQKFVNEVEREESEPLPVTDGKKQIPFADRSIEDIKAERTIKKLTGEAKSSEKAISEMSKWTWNETLHSVQTPQGLYHFVPDALTGLMECTCQARYYNPNVECKHMKGRDIKLRELGR